MQCEQAVNYMYTPLELYKFSLSYILEMFPSKMTMYTNLLKAHHAKKFKAQKVSVARKIITGGFFSSFFKGRPKLLYNFMTW